MTPSATVLRGIAVAAAPRTLLRPSRPVPVRAGTDAPAAMRDAPLQPLGPKTPPHSCDAHASGAQAMHDARAQRPAHEAHETHETHDPHPAHDGEWARERERIREAARHQGHAEGHADGYAAGREAGQRFGREEALRAAAAEAGEAAAARLVEEQAHEAELRRLSALVDAFVVQFDERLAAAEDDLLGLCFEALARVLGEDVLRDDVLTALVRQSIREARLAEGACVHVHPEDIELLQADATIAVQMTAQPSLRWIADEQVGAGGCVVTSAHGSLDARLETQLARLAAVFLRARGTEVSR